MAGGLGGIHDVVEQLGPSSAAIATLCVLPAGAMVAEHTHANPYLWLHALGGHAEASDAGAVAVAGPAAMFFPLGSAHRMAVRERGLASVIIEFDEPWLRHSLGPHVDLRRPRQWLGSEIGRRARELARSWLAGGPDAERFAATLCFLRSALGAAAPVAGPGWLDELDGLITGSEAAPPTRALAGRFDVSAPGWRGCTAPRAGKGWPRRERAVASRTPRSCSRPKPPGWPRSPPRSGSATRAT